MRKAGRVLIVDDDEDILIAGKLLLKRHFADVTSCQQPDMIPQLMAKRSFDAVLLDMNFGPGESSGKAGYRWLQKVLQLDSQAVVIMITAHGDIDTVVEAMKLGATDFVSKPWQNEKLVATVSSAVALSRTRTEANRLRTTNKILAEATQQQGGQKILGQSSAIQNVMSVIERTSNTDANILILGENGTGKELVARELHRKSQRANQVFMSVDLGAVSETLFESELFGHKKGAFTGAGEDRAGRFQAADGGTLFLDEIGNLPLHLQAKLLSVLAERKVTPLGTHKPIHFDVRVIAATNLSRDRLSDEKYFRQDLLFRLNTVEIVLPPLRQRADDIETIAIYYLNLYSRKYAKPNKPISTEALAAIKCYHWPGNIRALRHAVERAVILCEGEQLDLADFQLLPSTPPAYGAPLAVSDSSDECEDMSHDMSLEQIEKLAVSKALKKYRYNISHAAKALGLTRAALYRRMEKHGI